MSIYINAAQAIAPQLTFQQDQFLEEIKEYNTLMKCQLPNFKDFFNAMALRRMSRILKMSNTTALECLKEAGVEQPDAIITGTGLGCVEDTEKFLNKMLDTNEGFLNPTTFIQSTHNTLGAQIAVAKKCHNYNVAYVHKSLSFEWALLDSILLINEGEAHNILVGGIDEITEENYNLKKNIDLWKHEPFSNLNILNSETSGTIPGEGAAYFVISDQPTDQCYARVDFMNLKHKTKNIEDIEGFIQANLTAHSMSVSDIDMVLFGVNGDKPGDQVYYDLMKRLFTDNDKGYFKHLSGEYDTSSSFALWLAARILKNDYVPDIVKINQKKMNPQNILIYNQEKNRNHSIILLSKC